ncbi:MAG: GGDEF domain-containing protein [Cyanobacteria bacterium P01_H01_bin.162]
MKNRIFLDIDFLQMEILNILPNPVFMKDTELRYVLANQAFEDLFGVRREDLIGKLDQHIFSERQSVQCNASDLRVLESAEIDEALETVLRADSEPREMIIRKSRLTLPSGQRFLVGIMHDITEVSVTNRRLEESQKLLEQQSAALKRMAYTDPLTGCSNRRVLSLKAPEAFAQKGHVGSLLILDLDHFKRINDTYGHDVGDAILVHIVKVVSQIIRHHDELVRLGGEEFAVVLAGAQAKNACQIAERIRQSVESTPMFYGGSSIVITVSIGVVCWANQGPVDLDTMLIEGDRHLYKAKRNGRNCVVWATTGGGAV